MYYYVYVYDYIVNNQIFFYINAFYLRTSLIAQLVKKIHLKWRRHWFDSWVRKIPWSRDRLPTPVFLGFPCSSAGKESACNVGDLSLSPGLGRSPGEGKGYPLQYSGLENSMDCSPWGCKELDTTGWSCMYVRVGL